MAQGGWILNVRFVGVIREAEGTANWRLGVGKRLSHRNTGMRAFWEMIRITEEEISGGDACYRLDIMSRYRRSIDTLFQNVSCNADRNQ